MALAVLDGNQSATTLSSVVTGGEHIVAHSVASLGSAAISNITTAVSGAVVTIPALAHLGNSVATDGVLDSTTNFVKIGGHQSGSNQTAHIVHVSNGGAMSVDATDSVVSISNFPSTQTVAGTVTASVVGSVTVGSMPAISGTVTANVFGYNAVGDNEERLPILEIVDQIGAPLAVPVMALGTAAVAPRGALATRFGTPTTANTSFATSAVTKDDRKYLLIQNVTTQSNAITVGIGFTPTTTQGIQLTAGAGITFESSYIPTGAVYVLSSVTASNFTILEA